MNQFRQIIVKTANEAKQIPGLLYYPKFLPQNLKQKALHTINKHSWCNHLKRNQQYYGIKYFQTSYLDSYLQNKEQNNIHDLQQFKQIISLLINSGIFTSQNPPNQCLVNRYTKADRLGLHIEDKDAFGSIIAGITIGSTQYLRLSKTVDDAWMQKMPTENCQISELKNIQQKLQYKLKLDDCSLYVLTGDSRRIYRHGIGRTLQGKIYKDENFDRISLTFRHVLESRRKL